MRLTAELVEKSSSFINPVKDRELDLRSTLGPINLNQLDNKIPAIENLAVTRDQHDTIDLSCNELRRLDNFPWLRRLRTLLASHNAVTILQIDGRLPNLEMLVLNDNPISEVASLADLRSLTKLQHLSLIDCPVTRQPKYRLQAIKLLPQLRTLDFQKITALERRQAKALDEESLEANISLEERPSKMAKIDKEKVREALESAKTLDEIKQLERILATGNAPN